MTDPLVGGAGRAPTGQALVSDGDGQAVSTLTGFDPSRVCMVERVAKALFQLEWAHNGSEIEYANSRDYWMEGAREAIRAMREPTIDQTHAALDASRQSHPELLPVCQEIWASESVWVAMIDAALSERSGA